MLSDNLKYLGSRVLLGFSITTQILFPSLASAEPPRLNYKFVPRLELNISSISECLTTAERALQTQGLTTSRIPGEGVSKIVFGNNNFVTAMVECGNASTGSGNIWIIVSSNDPNNSSLATTYRDNIFDEMQIP
ncbi:MAG: hypothetical protein AAFV71_15675 [Cyanobacteria bacterium J06633_8]